MAWNDFLLTRHAVIEQNTIRRFTQPANLQQPVIADLTRMGLICFSGEESLTFLQNQLSSDVRELSHHKAQYSSYSTPKGRVLASFLMWQYQQQYYLQLDPVLLPGIQKRLSMYILRSKTQASDVTTLWGKFGLAGQNIRPTVEKALGVTAPQDMGMETLPDATLIISLPGDRFEVITPIAQAPALWQKFVAAGCVEAGDPIWQLSEIRALVPWVTQAVQEEFVPQMLNLDLIGGISFNKGCYPGQEIVARTQYLGKLKRRMFYATVNSDVPIHIGTDVFSPEMNGQSSGKIINAAPSPAGGQEVLVVAQISSLAYGLHLGDVEGPLLVTKNHLSL